jgi:hypothetical protein
VRTAAGQLTVEIPEEDEEETDINETEPREATEQEPRHSIRIQGLLAEIGAKMGFKVWVPRSDLSRVQEVTPPAIRGEFVADPPLNYIEAVIRTIEQIDVLWLRGRSIVRAFEVEHSTAIYSGLLRMADLVALQPNLNIPLHIVAPEERREKVIRELRRPVFSLFDTGPLADRCTFISYDSIEELARLPHLGHYSDSVLEEYEVHAELAEP